MAFEEKFAEYKSRVSDPEVTLEHDSHGFPEQVGVGAFLDWMCCFSASGDDGRQYYVETNPISLKNEKVDLWVMGVGWEQGKVVQMHGSTNKIADFQLILPTRHIYPEGTLKIKRSKKEVTIELPDFRLVCKDDHTWHYTIEEKEKGIKAEWVHTVKGFPTWYGKEKPKAITSHSITYGYNWSGTVEGTLTIQGRKVNIKGKGVRERYWAVDSCPGEIGAWEDWAWYHFDEMYGSMYEFKFNKVKEMSLNIVEGNRYFPVGNLNIEHHDWAFLRQIGAYVPTRYAVSIETEAGLLQWTNNVVGGKLWGATGEAPEAPVVSLDWDMLDGTFTSRDGRKKKLTNGRGGTVIRLWKPYPNPYADLNKGEITTTQGYKDNRIVMFE